MLKSGPVSAVLFQGSSRFLVLVPLLSSAQTMYGPGGKA
jgi:hypothetical protein